MPETSQHTAYERLRAAILTLELAPGDRLSERGLEGLLGGSRTPIRVALLRLENEGLTARTDRGWRVAPLDLAEIRAVSEYREALETAAAGLAAERATDDAVDGLRALAAASGSGSGDDEEAVIRDGSDFHVALARLSGNAFLADGVAGALVRLHRARWFEARSSASRASARTEHLAIVEAVAARDGATASRLVAEHVRGTRDRLLRHLEEEGRRLRGHGIAVVDD